MILPTEGAPSLRLRSGQALAFFVRVGGDAAGATLVPFYTAHVYAVVVPAQLCKKSGINRERPDQAGTR